MKQLSILCIALCLGVSTGQALAAGPGGGTGSPAAGGALGSSAARPGTNLLGTALASSDRGSGRRHKGAPLGTGSPDARRANRRADEAIHSICRGC